LDVAADILSDAEIKMQRAIENLRRELAGIRTGRASPGLVDRLQVEYYGAPTALNQIANVTTPEPRLLVIQPFERNIIPTIEKAILKSDLGLTPTNDGRVIRLQIPQLTAERRKDLVKIVKKRVEESKVAVRNIRRDAHDHIRALEHEKTEGKISEEDSKRYQERLQKLTDRMVVEVDQVGQKKEEEILEV
jgi:ribosome recycling factor